MPFSSEPPHSAHSLFPALHSGMFLQVLPFFFFFLSPSTHPSIHPCACLACYFRTIKVDFMLHGAFHHNGERSGTRERLVKGIFNSCHSHCMPLYVPCLLAQLTAPNMVPCSARLHRRKDLKRFNGAVPQLKLYCMQDAVHKQREAGQPQLHVIFLFFFCFFCLQQSLQGLYSMWRG